MLVCGWLYDDAPVQHLANGSHDLGAHAEGVGVSHPVAPLRLSILNNGRIVT